MIVAWLTWNHYVEKRGNAERFLELSSRQLYSNREEWLAKHWAEYLGEVEFVIHVCGQLATRLAIDPTQLYSTDRFDKDLAIRGKFLLPIDVDDAVCCFFDEDVVSEVSPSVVAGVSTLGQLVNLVAKSKWSESNERESSTLK